MKLLTRLNLAWICAILAATLVGSLSVQWSTVQNLPDIISLALSLASLILALIAIVQTLTSNDSLARSVSDVSRAAENARVATAKVEEASLQIAAHVKTFSDLPSSIDKLNLKIDQLNASTAIETPALPSPTTETKEGKAEDSADAWLPHTTVGTALALYMCLRSQESGVPINGRLVFGTKGEYYSGAIAGLVAAGAVEASIAEGKFTIKSLGKLTRSKIMATLERPKAREFKAEQLMKIDEYFALASSRDE